MKTPNVTEGEEMRVESVVEQNIAAMVHELTNRSSTTLIERQGNDLVIKMTNGEEVVVESFFIAFSETQFHEMQAGVYGQDEAVDVVEVADTSFDENDDDANNDAPQTAAHTGGDMGIGGILAIGAGVALVGGAAGGGGSSSSSSDEEEPVITEDEEPVTAAMMDLDDEHPDNAQMTQEEFAELVAAGEDGADTADAAEAAPAEPVIMDGENSELAMAQFDMAPTETAWDDMSQQAEVI